MWYQLIKLGYGALDSFTMVTPSAGLPISLVASSANVTVVGTGTFAVQIDAGAVTSLALIDDIVHSGDAVLAKYAVMGAVLDDVGTGTVTENQANALRMSSRRALLVEGVASGTAITVGTHDVTQATGSNLHMVVDSGTVTTVSTVTSLTQMNGAAIAMNTGPRAAGVQRVTIATDDIVPASQSGTWTVQPGNTANTTPWLASLNPATAGGWTTFHLESAGTTNATNLKASAGQVGGWYIYNANAAMRKVAFHNSAGTPTAGASIYFTVPIPGLSAANVEFTNGIPFGTGIAITTVTGLTDASSTAVAADDLNINIFYK